MNTDEKNYNHLKGVPFKWHYNSGGTDGEDATMVDCDFKKGVTLISLDDFEGDEPKNLTCLHGPDSDGWDGMSEKYKTNYEEIFKITLEMVGEGNYYADKTNELAITFGGWGMMDCAFE